MEGIRRCARLRGVEENQNEASGSPVIIGIDEEVL
jgi:hypothetical protein